MARRKVTYRPSKAAGIVGVVVGSIFVLIGLFTFISTGGFFGILWTLVAAAITAGNAYTAFGKKYVGPEIHIEEDSVENHDTTGSTIEDRLRELRNLYDLRLITDEEYESKRQEILREL